MAAKVIAKASALAGSVVSSAISVEMPITTAMVPGR